MEPARLCYNMNMVIERKNALKQYSFDVIVNDTPYAVSINLEADDHWDAEEQIRETICNRFSRDKDDQRELVKQAAKQFINEFIAALDAGHIEDVREG